VIVCAVLHLDPAAAVTTYRQLAEAAAPLCVRYAVKANPHPALLAALAAAGAPFAVSSLGDLDALAAVGVDGARITSVSPGPPASLLRRFQALGVRRLTVDTPWELKKVAALVPGAAVCVALRLPPAGRLRYPAAPLGCPLDALDALLAVARGLPIDLCGVAVHVGSQCERQAPWAAAVAVASAAWRRLLAEGYRPRVLSLGGGLPVSYRGRVPTASAILAILRRALAAHFAAPPAEVWLEPGRYLAAGAGALAATVLAVDARPAARLRVQVDVGRYRGLPEAALGIRYPCLAEVAGPLARSVLVGPLGEARDLLDRDVGLPPLRPGDRLWLFQAGAYTFAQTAYAQAGGALLVRVGALPNALTRARAAASRTPAAASTPAGSGGGRRS
jgi:ornithine decarboxylase